MLALDQLLRPCLIHQPELLRPDLEHDCRWRPGRDGNSLKCDKLFQRHRVFGSSSLRHTTHINDRVLCEL